MGERFARERVMHELRMRRVRVVRSASVAPGMRRVTLGGDDLEGFVTPAPGDHVMVIFPDPQTGELTVPTPGERGLRAPEGAGQVIVRDYTPLALRTGRGGEWELDIDFYLPGDDGPASAWASRASAGDEIAIGGPRGSLMPPPMRMKR